ncbi:MAG: L-seryl-tRNA(Sec) selenium transferase [Pseudomonadota bacterium]
MTTPADQKTLSLLPQVDKLLRSPEILAWEGRLTLKARASLIRQTLDEARSQIKNGETPPPEAELIQQVLKKFSLLLRPTLQKAINATGIVLHTNLGRAPIPKQTLIDLASELSGYCTLEINPETASRGQRTDHIEELLSLLTGAESALVVNNGAAAVFLILNALSWGKDTLISRGELVQIGGGFRMPEILQQSGALLKEVGTTNITRLDDYESALSENSALILKVHPSCFSITGHTESPSLTDLSELARAKKIPLAIDWGSGALTSRENGEVSISEILSSGCDLLSFSGDKLFGASQAGIVVGKKSWIEKLKKSPLSRALRLGKLDLFVLERTLLCHLQGNRSTVDELLSFSPAELEARAVRVSQLLEKNQITATLRKGTCPIGGGSTPNEELETCLLEIGVLDSEKAARKLASFSPGIFVRKEKGKVLVDLRTVFPEEEARLVEGLACLF